MDFGSILKKMKENVFLIEESKFDKLADGKGYTDVVVYLVIAMLINLVLSALVSLVLGSGAFMVALIAIPVALVMGVIFAFIMYGIMHLLLKLFGGKATYNQTFQVYVYGLTCQYLLGWIPVVGIIAALVSLVNVVKGAARVHKLSLLNTVLAIVVIPLIVFILLVVLMAGLVLAVLGPQLGSMFTQGGLTGY